MKDDRVTSKGSVYWTILSYLVTRRSSIFKAPDSYRKRYMTCSFLETIIKGGGAVLVSC